MHTLRNLTEEEAKGFNDEFNELLKKHEVEVSAVPRLVPSKDAGFTIGTEFTVLKKVELVPLSEKKD
jgi:hypothetical protein